MNQSEAIANYPQQLLFTIKPPHPQVIQLIPTIREYVVARHVQSEFSRIARTIRDVANKIHGKTEQYRLALGLLADYSKSSIEIEIDVAYLYKQQGSQWEAVRRLQVKRYQVCASIDQRQKSASTLLADVEELSKRLVGSPLQ